MAATAAIKGSVLVIKCTRKHQMVILTGGGNYHLSVWGWGVDSVPFFYPIEQLTCYLVTYYSAVKYHPESLGLMVGLEFILS